MIMKYIELIVGLLGSVVLHVVLLIVLLLAKLK